VPLDEAEFEKFYLGFSNATLWPLYHDAVRTPTFHRDWWYAYVSVNDRFRASRGGRRRAGSDGLGTRLPVAVGSEDAQG
jgi:hypothetical protein